MTWTTRQRSEGAGGLGFFSAGNGPALVLIHGVGLRAEAWGAMVPRLAAQFCVYGVDMPGHGASTLGAVHRLEDYVDRMQSFVDTLDGPVCLAGHSMGAILAMKLAARMGERVAGMAALNAIYRRSSAAKTAVTARAQAISQGGKADSAPTLARWFGAAPQGAMRDAALACDDWLRRVDPQAYGRAYTAFAQQDGPSVAELKQLACPALFMTGAGDLNSTPAMSDAMAKLAPKGHALVIEDAAHMMPMTHADAVVAALINTFQPRKANT